jgi:ribosomal protein S6
MDATLTDQKVTTYDITFTLSGEDSSRVKALLVKHGASISSERPLEKIRFAYPIQKQAYAFMGVIRFTGIANLDAFEKELALEGVALRFLVHKVNVKGEAAQLARANRPGRDRAYAPRETTETVLTNEALEKKIEEILK